MSRNGFGLLVLSTGSLCTFAAVTYILRSQWLGASRGAVLLAAAMLVALIMGTLCVAFAILLRLSSGSPSPLSPTRLSSSAPVRVTEFVRWAFGDQMGAREADRDMAVALKGILAKAESDSHAETLLLRHFRAIPDETDAPMRLAQFHQLLSGYRRGNEATAHTRILIQRFIDDLERCG